MILATLLSVQMLAPTVYADGCIITTDKADFDRLGKAEGAEKAGRYQEAYSTAEGLLNTCFDEPEEARIYNVLKKTSPKLGDDAEQKGRFAEAYDYYKYYDGSAADRVQMKLAASRPDDLQTVRSVVLYFRDKQEKLGNVTPDSIGSGDLDRTRRNVMYRYMSIDQLDAIDPGRDKRLQAIGGYQARLDEIAVKNGDKFLAEEDKVFAARKTSATAKMDTLAELQSARSWLELAGEEKRAADRAIRRGDALMAEDGRKALVLAISYYEFAADAKKEQSVRDKARRLGDTHLQKGDKVMAAEYFDIAGLHDKAIGLREIHEAEKQKSEAKRQSQFEQEQKSLEEELGL
jgi:hypothetical protein